MYTRNVHPFSWIRHLKAADPDVVVGAAVRQAGRRGDGLSGTAAHRGATANNAEGNLASLSVEWL